jgi:predicted deacylase
VAGSVTFVPITNPLAYAKGVRNGDRNLNRNLFPNDDPQDFEDRIANWLCPLLGQHDVLLDALVQYRQPAFRHGRTTQQRRPAATLPT